MIMREAIESLIPSRLHPVFIHPAIYLKNTWAFTRLYPGLFDVSDTIKFFPHWNRSLTSSSSPLQDRMPWLTFSAIQFLEQVLHTDMRVYEYGSGGSTLFFAPRVKEVISVEHDLTWANEVRAVLEKQGYQNTHLSHIESDTNAVFSSDLLSDVDACLSESAMLSFKEYVTSITKYPDSYFDIVLVDGRARASCLKYAIPKVKVGGYIILDDSDRERYQAVMSTPSLRDNFNLLDFVGPKLYDTVFAKTSIWHRRR